MEPQQEYVLVNTSEEIVKRLTRDLMDTTDMCQCEKCFLDSCALALNSLKGHYVTSKKGEKIAGVLNGTMESKIEIAVSVTKAIELVKDKPMHN